MVLYTIEKTCTPMDTVRVIDATRKEQPRSRLLRTVNVQSLDGKTVTIEMHFEGSPS